MASLIDQLVKNPPATQETPVQFWVRKICWRRDRLPTQYSRGFPCGSAGKESACNAGNLNLILGLGKSPGEGKGCPLQYSGVSISGLENSMNCIVNGVTKSQTRLSDVHFTSLHIRTQGQNCVAIPSFRWLPSEEKETWKGQWKAPALSEGKRMGLRCERMGIMEFWTNHFTFWAWVLPYAEWNKDSYIMEWQNY